MEGHQAAGLPAPHSTADGRLFSVTATSDSHNVYLDTTVRGPGSDFDARRRTEDPVYSGTVDLQENDFWPGYYGRTHVGACEVSYGSVMEALRARSVGPKFWRLPPRSSTPGSAERMAKDPNRFSGRQYRPGRTCHGRTRQRKSKKVLWFYTNPVFVGISGPPGLFAGVQDSGDRITLGRGDPQLVLGLHSRLTGNVFAAERLVRRQPRGRILISLGAVCGAICGHQV